MWKYSPHYNNFHATLHDIPLTALTLAIMSFLFMHPLILPTDYRDYYSTIGQAGYGRGGE